jgi:pyruvate/2-oxoglutarate dehydrogenase complex dihydrolipoamide acyltransferase (E2) component
MSEKIAFVYNEKRNPRGAFIPGIPNRNITVEEFAALPIGQQSAIVSAAFFTPAVQVPDEFEEELAAVKLDNFPDPFAAMATDEARALADEHGINLFDVEGTGQDGRILKRDILALINGAD